MKLKKTPQYFSTEPASYSTLHRYGSLHRSHNKRQEIRLKSWRRSYCIPLERFDKGLDSSHATDVCRRQMGSVYPCKYGIRQVLAARNTWRFDTYIRNRIIRNSVAIATLFLFLYTSSRTLSILDKTISRATLKLLHATTFLVSSANSLLCIQAEHEAPPAA